MNIPNENLINKRVIVGLSGGVDSAVAALLLKQQGADVQALHMTNWNDEDGYCNAADDLQDAKKVCNKLSIPLHHVNFSKEYAELVFKHFLHEYKNGRTPNPDILCNREIKFGVFKKYAKRLGAEFIATGHYAKLNKNVQSTELVKPKDKSKDQTYFLHAVNEDALRDTLFPLCDLTKNEVRDMAKMNGLSNYDKKDSTGICFIGERPFREFLEKYLPAQPGPMIDNNDNVIGQHQGLMYYTIGQRQGLNIGGRKESDNKPWYVLNKDLASNTLIVVQGDHDDLYAQSLIVSDFSWIGTAKELILSAKVIHCHGKVRYRQPDQACQAELIEGNKIKVIFNEPQRAITEGQAAVLYIDDRCLGGGSIDEVIK